MFCQASVGKAVSDKMWVYRKFVRVNYILVEQIDVSIHKSCPLRYVDRVCGSTADLQQGGGMEG